MKVTLTPETTFTLNIGRHAFLRMKKISEWNGFLELKNAQGQSAILASAVGAMEQTLNNITRPDAPTAWMVIKASVDILNATNDEVSKASTPEQSP